jgi:flagellar hook-length control protein FliK
LRPASLARLNTAPDDAVTVANDSGQGDAGAANQGQGDASSAPSAALQLATTPAAAAASASLAPAAAALAQAHGAEITAQLAAQIASRAGQVRSSFDFSLDPQGLGRVDVSLKIDPQGGLSALFSFDSPAVAAEARSRSGELQQQLQQAGFDVAQSGLSFTSGGGQGHGAAFQSDGSSLYAVQAPGFADAAPPELPAISASLAAATATSGLDITI